MQQIHNKKDKKTKIISEGMEKIARIGYKLCISICKAIQAKLQYFIIFLQKVIANPMLNKRNSTKQEINP